MGDFTSSLRESLHFDALQLSARSMHRILRVARTIADLANSPQIATSHLAEALGYRRIDRGVAAATGA